MLEEVGVQAFLAVAWYPAEGDYHSTPKLKQTEELVAAEDQEQRPEYF